jgi:oligoribonuclease (3'-5' exoribonuclease)
VVLSSTAPDNTELLWIDTSSTGVQPSSDEVVEGTTNLYFTEARARAAVIDPFFLMGA